MKHINNLDLPLEYMVCVMHIKRETADSYTTVCTVCLRERGKMGGDSNRLSPVDAGSQLQTSVVTMETSRVPMVTQGVYQGHNMILYVCLWGFSWAPMKHFMHKPAAPRPRAVSPVFQYHDPAAPISSTRYHDSETQNIIFLNSQWQHFSSGSGEVFFRLKHLSKVSLCVFDWLCVYDYMFSLCDIWCNFRNFITCTTARSNRAATCPNPPQIEPHPTLACMKEW